MGINNIRWYRRDGTPYPPGIQGAFAWSADYSDPAKRVVRQDPLPNGYLVSTVFLGLDHNHWGGPPLLFETMVFTSIGMEDFQERYSTEDDAIIGHMQAVDLFATRLGLSEMLHSVELTESVPASESESDSEPKPDNGEPQ